MSWLPKDLRERVKFLREGADRAEKMADRALLKMHRLRREADQWEAQADREEKEGKPHDLS